MNLRPTSLARALALVVWLGLALGGGVAAAGDLEGKPLIQVSASAPLEAERLADALRVYLDTPRWEVEVVSREAAATGPSQRQLGDAARPVAVVQVRSEGQGLTLDIFDRATNKLLVARLAPPERPADLYRALALKTEALLRVTFSEEPATAETSALVARLPPASRTAGWPPGGGSLGVGWQERGFFRGARREGTPTFGGVAVSANLRFTPRWWAGAELDALLPMRASVDDVSLVATRVPLLVRVGGALPRGLWEGRGALLVEGAYVDVASSSTATMVRDARGFVFAAGAELGARYAVRGAWAASASLAVLQNLRGLETTVHGKPGLDMSGWSLLVTLGLNLSL